MDLMMDLMFLRQQLLLLAIGLVCYGSNLNACPDQEHAEWSIHVHPDAVHIQNH